MNSSSTSIDIDGLTLRLRDSIAAGLSREDVIQAMRTSGLDQIACIKMLRDLSGISLGDAKEAVHYSSAWADRRKSTESLHEATFQAADKLGFIEITN